MYFTHASDAVRFSDPVMCRVTGEADLLVIKQYWPGDELEHALRPPRLVAFDGGRVRDRSRRRGQSGSRHDGRDRGRESLVRATSGMMDILSDNVIHSILRRTAELGYTH